MIKDRQFSGLWEGVNAARPVMLGYLGIGLTAGIAGSQAGLSPAEITLLSILLFAGSAQFVFAQLWAAGGLILIPTIFFLNFRHFLYSASFAPRVKDVSLVKRFAIGAQLTDETFSLASVLLGTKRLHSARWMLALNFSCYSVWTLANLLGALLGNALDGINVLGLDFGLTAMYAAILMLLITASQDKLARVLALIMMAAGLIVLLEIYRPHPINILLSSVLSASICLFLFPPSKNTSARKKEK